jgi:hypothetical protein
LGDDGRGLLASDGERVIIQLEVPGQAALNASHPHFTIDDLRARGDVPNIAKEFIEAWSYRVAHPEFDPGSLERDCGMVFTTAVPPQWIRNIER